jgi:hypothetical protein
MTQGEFSAKLEEIGQLAVELRDLFSNIETTDDRYPRFKELLEELGEYI